MGYLSPSVIFPSSPGGWCADRGFGMHFSLEVLPEEGEEKEFKLKCHLDINRVVVAVASSALEAAHNKHRRQTQPCRRAYLRWPSCKQLFPRISVPIRNRSRAL